LGDQSALPRHSREIRKCSYAAWYVHGTIPAHVCREHSLIVYCHSLCRLSLLLGDYSFETTPGFNPEGQELFAVSIQLGTPDLGGVSLIVLTSGHHTQQVTNKQIRETIARCTTK
jgi:hypothetical protein